VAKRSTGRFGRWFAGLVLVVAAVEAGRRWAERYPVVAGVVLGVVLVCVVTGLVLVAYLRDRVAARQAELERGIGSADGLTGPEFERWFARLLTRSGFTRVVVRGGAGDLGADVVAISPLGKRAVFQCKRHSRNVPDRYVQQFAGTCRAIHGADIAAIVTTAGFTGPARQLARRLDIVLVDRDALAAWAADRTPPEVFGRRAAAA
jgi:restriction system protein